MNSHKMTKTYFLMIDFCVNVGGCSFWCCGAVFLYSERLFPELSLWVNKVSTYPALFCSLSFTLNCRNIRYA